MSLVECQNNPIDVNFHRQIFLEVFDKKSAADTFRSKRKGVGKCPPSCQLGQNQLLTLFSECDAAACTRANRECDGATNSCKCKSGFVEDPAIASPGPTSACVAGKKH